MSTNTSVDPAAIPETYRELVDDAAIFPPGNAPLPDAVSAHRQHLAAAHAGLVGPFVVSDLRLPELIETVGDEAAPTGPLAVSVVVSGGAGAVEPAVRWATGAGSLDLRCVEIALRDEADLAHNARRMVTAVDQLLADGVLDEDVRVYVEPPRLHGQPPHSWLAALDELAAMDLRLKFRTGGVAPEAFPDATELATSLAAALDRELAFKCTAGLHNALRHQDEQQGFEHHGFLNVLLATRASLDGAGTDEVATVLDETDATLIREQLDELGPDRLVATRRWFTSFGSCSILEPLQDLIDLHLIPDPRLEPA